MPYHDTLAECTSRVDVCDTRVNVHSNGLTLFFDKNLLQQHPRDFARFNIGVGNEMPFWSVRTAPAETEAFFVRSARLNKNVALSGNFCLDSTTKRLRYFVSPR
jgi:hypothetical protein